MEDEDARKERLSTKLRRLRDDLGRVIGSPSMTEEGLKDRTQQFMAAMGPGIDASSKEAQIDMEKLQLDFNTLVGSGGRYIPDPPTVKAKWVGPSLEARSFDVSQQALFSQSINPIHIKTIGSPSVLPNAPGITTQHTWHYASTVANAQINPGVAEAARIFTFDSTADFVKEVAGSVWKYLWKVSVIYEDEKEAVIRMNCAVPLAHLIAASDALKFWSKMTNQSKFTNGKKVTVTTVFKDVINDDIKFDTTPPEVHPSASQVNGVGLQP